MQVKGRKVNVAFLGIAAGALTALLIGNVLLANNKDTISMYLGGYSGAGAADTSTYTAEGCYSEGRALNEKLAEESTVLLKNKNNALPLASKTKVTFLGSMSYNYIICGNGSGSGADDADTVMMNDAFTNAGMDVNAAAWAALQDACGGSRKATPKYAIDAGSTWSSFTKGTEFSAADYKTFMPDSVLTGYTGGYAVVTIGRNGAEGAAPSFDMKGSGNMFDQTYLELTQNEKDLLTFTASKFDHVIVLVNSAAPMELGFLDLSAYKIDAALWIGYPGENGIQGVANAIANVDGAAPSGRLADIWAYDETTNPTYYNSGYNQYTNLNIAGEDGGPGLVAGYLDYEEGIYVGYRYYETADELGYFDSSSFKAHTFKGNIKDTDGVYDSDYSGSAYETPVYSGSYGRLVQYAFGYGQSYATFDQKITKSSISLDAHKTNTVTVSVTNKSATYSGKDVIQLYMDAPKGNDATLGVSGYGFEKAKRTLVAFAKSDVLAPGESKEYTLSFATDDLASFDDAGQNAYVLEKGDYTFEICSDSHTVIASSDKISKASSLVYNEKGVGKRDSDLVVATNHMDDVAAGDGMCDAGPAGYMSRFNGTKGGFEYAWSHIWDKAPNRANEAMAAEPKKVAKVAGLGSQDYTYKAYKGGVAYDKTQTFYMKGATQEAYETVTPDGLGQDDASYAVKNGSTATSYTIDSRFDTISHQYVCEKSQLGSGDYEKYDTTNTVGFADISYDDPLWSDLLSQISIEEEIEVQGNSGWGIPKIDSIGKPYVQDIDGPGESGNGSFKKGTCWVSEVNLSATFNTALVKEMGEEYGHQSIVHKTGGAYAPAMNAHRSPFEGRFFEYFCEDPLVAGKMGAAEVKGIQSTGTAVFIKHMALNDDCSTSPGAFTFVKEQAGREMYYKPYELAIKEGGARGIMSSVIRIGFSFSHYGLFNNITRQEWGFNGYIITDGFSQRAEDFMTANMGLYGGVEGMLSHGSYLNSNGIPETEGTNAYTTNYGKHLLQNAMHHMLYQYVGTSGVAGYLNTSWYGAWIAGDVVLAGVAITFLVLAILQFIGKKNKAE